MEKYYITSLSESSIKIGWLNADDSILDNCCIISKPQICYVLQENN
jgi:hypothetical protein